MWGVTYLQQPITLVNIHKPKNLKLDCGVLTLYLNNVASHAFEVLWLIISVNQPVTTYTFMFRTTSQHIQQSKQQYADVHIIYFKNLYCILVGL